MLTAGAAFDHAGDEAFAAVHQPHDVDRDQAVPVLGRGVKESGPDTDSGVVDQQIDGVEPGVDRVGEFVHRIGVGDVDGLGEHLGAQSAG